MLNALARWTLGRALRRRLVSEGETEHALGWDGESTKGREARDIGIYG